MKKINLKENVYNQDYYERGLVTGLSGYMNFSWMPELTIRMAHFMIANLGITRQDKILDFGCAKGFLVKAFRLLNCEAFGVDISLYAIQEVDSSVRNYCFHILGSADPKIYSSKYDWMIAKDVFEHINEDELRDLLIRCLDTVKKIFVVVPLGLDDHSGKYIVPEYDRDVTHVIVKSKEWWMNFFCDAGWRVENFNHSFDGCKENWTTQFPDGNGFFSLVNANSKV